jgi:hypothetical protein
MADIEGQTVNRGKAKMVDGIYPTFAFCFLTWW